MADVDKEKVNIFEHWNAFMYDAFSFWSVWNLLIVMKKREREREKEIGVVKR